MDELSALKNPEKVLLNQSEDLKPEDTLTPELIIAFCSPIGTPVHQVVKVLENILYNNFSSLLSFFSKMNVKINRLSGTMTQDRVIK